MGKKIQSPAERARIQQAAAERRREKEMKQFKILTTALAAIIAIAAIVALIVHLHGLSGLPAEIKDVSTIQDNWIVIDTNNKVSKRYHHPASFDIPAGYTKSDFSLFNDEYERDFYVEADSEDAVVSSVYVCAAPELTAAEYIQRLLDYSGTALNEGTTVETGEPFSAAIAGKDAQCLYLHYTVTAEDGSTQAYGCLYTAFNAPKNVCVYASISGAYTTPENVQTAETLLAEAETLLAGLTIVE